MKPSAAKAMLMATPRSAHLANVDAQIKKALSMATMTRQEIHGPEEELSKMRAPLASPNPAWFVHQTGLDK